MEWDRYTIDGIGLSIEVVRAWPVEEILTAETGNVYQRIADTGGLLFVRYGEAETLDRFVSTLGDYVTHVAVARETNGVVAGQEAQEMVLHADREPMHGARWVPGEGLAHGEVPAVRTTIRVSSLTNRGLPILVGYRMPDLHLDAFRSVLERSLGSITITP